MDATNAGALYICALEYKGWAFKDDVRNDARLAELILDVSLQQIAFSEIV